ncbi:uncharacterized protein [Miscanthus floridulus]|uniref:uncharacterized protein n=1 Tax=Miscanthus floridulus TaxID=154761 RepID=UPI0034584264
MESPAQVSCRHRNTFVSFDLIRSVSCAARAKKQRRKLKGRGESVILVGKLNLAATPEASIIVRFRFSVQPGPVTVSDPSMAQTPEGATAPVQAPRSLPELPFGCVFHPDGPCLLKRYLLPMALSRVPDEPYQGFVADGVDVYAARPEALPFPRCNRGLHDKVWDYYFTTRPAVRRREGVRQRRRGGLRVPPQVRVPRGRGPRQEDGVEDGVPPQRGSTRLARRRAVVFHPSAKGLVIWKVYNAVIPEEEPAVDYYNINDDDGEEEEIGAVVITVGDAAAAPTP